jgi:hypothetical protein
MYKSVILGTILLTSGLSIAAPEKIDFIKESSELNKTLPIMIDEETQLDGTFFINNTFVYKNTLVNYNKDEITEEYLKNGMTELITNFICTTPEMKGFTDNGVSVGYRYYGNKGSYITEIKVSPDQCGKVYKPRDGIAIKEKEVIKLIPINEEE